MKFTRVLFPVLLILSSFPAAADILTDLLPPDSKVVFGIRVHGLVLSSVAHTFAAQAQTAAAGWLKTVPLDGIDLLRDIDEVLIASPGKGQNPSSLILVTGRFDVARLTEGATRYHGVPVLAGETETDNVVALLDNGIALIGDPVRVHAAIDQRGGKNRIDAGLNDRITSLRQRYDVWGLGERPEGFVPPIPEVKVVESIDRFQFGMQMASGLELGAEIHARSPEDAGKLNDELVRLAALVKGPDVSAGATRFEVQKESGTLKLTVFIPDGELKRIIEAETATLSPVSTATPVPETQENGPNSVSDPPPVAPAAPPAPPSSPAPAVATQAAPANAQAAPRPASPRTLDSPGDTVVLTLPGKK